MKKLLLLLICFVAPLHLDADGRPGHGKLGSTS